MNELMRAAKAELKNTTAEAKSPSGLLFYLPKGLKVDSDLFESIETEKAKSKLRVVETLRAFHNKNVAILNQRGEQEIDEPVPFLELKIENTDEVYKIGKSFLNDILDNKKNFGFCSLGSKSSDLTLLAYGSFMSYSLKAPVLLIIQDLNAECWKKYAPHFSDGQLSMFKTREWGKVCLIDHKQLNRMADDFNRVNIDELTEEFGAVLWSLPGGSLQKKLATIYLSVIRQLDSVTLLIKSGVTTGRELKDNEKYYACFDVPVKGILNEGGPR